MLLQGREIKTVAVDFDGTLFVEEYPNIGKPIWSIINYVKYLKDQGAELILHTNREGVLLDNAIEACRAVGIEFDAVNENVSWRVKMYGPSRKVGADLYIDDKSINPKSIIESKSLPRSYHDTYYKNVYFRRSIQLLEEGVDPVDVVKQLSDEIMDLINNETYRKIMNDVDTLRKVDSYEHYPYR